MMLLILLVFGIISLIVDLRRGKKGLWALIWNNFKWFFMLLAIQVLVIIWIVTVYTMAKVIDLNSIINRSIWTQLEWQVLMFGFIALLVILFFKFFSYEVKYKNKRGKLR